MTNTPQLREAIDDEMIAQPEMRDCYYEVLASLKASEYDMRLVDAIVQRPGGYDIYDAYWFAKCYAEIMTGNVGIVAFDAHDVPWPDRNRAENNAILKKLEPMRYQLDDSSTRLRACFHGGYGDSDGSVTVLDPFFVNVHVLDDGSEDCRVSRTRIDARIYPLEVGTTLGGTTWLHLVRHGGVARWPYGSTDIVLMATLKFFSPGL